MVDKAALGAYAGYVLEDATIPELPNHYRGKVRDNYDLPDGRRIIIASDRLSAFDRNLAAIPLKGQVLTQTAKFWFEATADICPNHVIEYPDPNVLIGRKLTILPVEIVVRDYLAGTTGTSILSLYKAGQREMYGIRLADGMRDNEKLPETIITPTSKAFHGGHDEPLTPAEIVGQGLLSEEQWKTVSDYALALFAKGRAMARERGLILVDTKYEFGIDENGTIMIADEIHTPDSQPLLVPGELPAALRGRRAARELRQGFRPHLGRRPLRPLQGRHSRDPTGRRARDLAGLYRCLRAHHRTDLRIAGSGRAGAGAGAGESEGVFLKLVDVSASHPYFALHDHRSHHFHELFYAVPIGRLRSVATRRSMPPLSGGIFIW